MPAEAGSDESPEVEDNFAFDSVLFYGRTLAEYVRMFDLNLKTLSGRRVLDCSAGPASFASEALALGIEVVACDPMYGTPGSELSSHIVAQVEATLAQQQRVWHLFDEAKQRFAQVEDKLVAFRTFIADYEQGLASGRYVQAILPSLPFPDGSFDLCLSSNFLFLYSDYAEGGMLYDSPYDYDFHLKSLLELLRVSRGEVLLYPLKGPHRDEYPHRERLIADLAERGVRAERVPVPYRDIKGAFEMLRVRRAC